MVTSLLQRRQLTISTDCTKCGRGWVVRLELPRSDAGRIATINDSSDNDFEDSFAYADYHEALADPAVDAVVVAAPSDHHCAIVIATAQAGKHVLCQKPMAMNVAECDAMLAAVEKAGVKLQIGFMRRFDASFMAAKQRVESGEAGRVVRFSQVRSFVPVALVPTGRSSSNAVDIKFLGQLFGLEIEAVIRRRKSPWAFGPLSGRR